jgi:hypothetical protein
MDAELPNVPASHIDANLEKNLWRTSWRTRWLYRDAAKTSPVSNTDEKLQEWRMKVKLIRAKSN